MARTVLQDIHTEGTIDIHAMRSIKGGAAAQQSGANAQKSQTTTTSEKSSSSSTPSSSTPSSSTSSSSTPSSASKTTSTTSATSTMTTTSNSKTQNGQLTNDPSAKNTNAHNHQSDGIHDGNNRVGNNGLGSKVAAKAATPAPAAKPVVAAVAAKPVVAAVAAKPVVAAVAAKPVVAAVAAKPVVAAVAAKPVTAAVAAFTAKSVVAAVAATGASGSRTNHGAITNDPSANNPNAHDHQKDGIHDDNNRIGNNGLGSGEKGKKHEARRVSNKAGAWDVYFDNKDALNGGAIQRMSPIILDLDGNKKADITGANVLGDGKIDGETVLFDIDPSRQSTAHKLVSFEWGTERAGYAAAGDKTFDGVWKDYKIISRNSQRGTVELEGGHTVGLRGIESAQRGKNAAGEDVIRGWQWGGEVTEKRERTEWIKKGTGDGFLAWDVDGDGKITSNKELFGNFDTDGAKKFDNGYEKLAKYFDKNKDGVVSGDEMKGLKIWRDVNADGITQDGELMDVKAAGITRLDVKNIEKSDLSSSFDQEGDLKAKAILTKKSAGTGARETFEIATGSSEVDTKSGYVSLDISQRVEMTSDVIMKDAFIFSRKNGKQGIAVGSGGRIGFDLNDDADISSSSVNTKDAYLTYNSKEVSSFLSLDSNKDGKINKSDKAFSDLRLVRVETFSLKVNKTLQTFTNTVSWSLDKEGIAEISLACVKKADTRFDNVGFSVGLKSDEEKELKDSVLKQASSFMKLGGDRKDYAGIVNFSIDSSAAASSPTAQIAQIYKDGQVGGIGAGVGSLGDNDPNKNKVPQARV